MAMFDFGDLPDSDAEHPDGTDGPMFDFDALPDFEDSEPEAASGQGRPVGAPGAAAGHAAAAGPGPLEARVEASGKAAAAAVGCPRVAGWVGPEVEQPNKRVQAKPEHAQGKLQRRQQHEQAAQHDQGHVEDCAEEVEQPKQGRQGEVQHQKGKLQQHQQHEQPPQHDQGQVKDLAEDDQKPEPVLPLGRDIVICLKEDGQSELRFVSLHDAVQHFLDKARKRGPASAVVFKHRDEERPVSFGGWFGLRRAPVVFLEAPAEDVATYIREDPEGPFAELSVGLRDNYWETWGFDEDQKETMLKQDWHAVPQLYTDGKFFVPRLATGEMLMRAPPRVMAFVVAFRVVNKACWNAIIDTLQGMQNAREIYVKEKFGAEVLQGYKKTRDYVTLDSIIEVLRSSRQFGVVESQVRWGKESRRMPSHKDGATSLLHLSITLGGHRVVWAGTFEDNQAAMNEAEGTSEEEKAAEEPQDPEKNVYDERLWRPPRLQRFEMTPGCTYVSSPFCFEHAVEYSACGHSEPVIALQCRFGFPLDLGKRVNNLRNKEMLDIATVMSEALRAAGCSGQLRMPTLNEVMQAEVQLKAQLESMLQNQ